MSKNERMNITEFLEARIAEDESRANAWQSRLDDLTIPAYMIGGTLNPASLLAECAAKRELVEIHTTCDDVSYGDASTCPEIRTLAAVYKDHPDYQPEWAV
jgi:hypothetical protein